MTNKGNPVANTGAAAGSITIPNMDNVEVKVTKVAPGQYPAKLLDVNQGTSQTGNPKLTFVFEVTTAQGRTMKSSLFCSITPSALWKLKRTTEALGIPSGSMDVAEMVGRKCMVNMVDSDDGKFSNIAGCDPMTEGTETVDTNDNIPF